MAEGRDWKEFNNAWRKKSPFGRWLWSRTHCLRYSIRRIRDDPHRAVKTIEPWGILAAAIGLILAIATFWFDYSDRVEERTVRAWQLLTTDAPGNSGKRAALEYLNQRGTPLRGIHLSVSEGKAGAYLSGINLSGANLGGASFSRAILDSANLSEAHLWKVDLSGADLTRADLSGAILQWTDFSSAELSLVDLSSASIGNVFVRSSESLSNDNPVFGVDFSEAKLWHANLSSVDMDVEGIPVKGLTQEQLDEACGNESTSLPDSLNIPMCSKVDWFKAAHGRSR